MKNLSRENPTTETERLLLEVRSMNNPLEAVKKILEEIKSKGTVTDIHPDLLAILVNNTESLVAEIERSKEQK